MTCFAWSGFPQYAARCIGAYVSSTGDDCVVVATRPAVPIKGMEEVCKCPVIWIDSKDDTGQFISRLNSIPDVLFVDGWAIKPFNLLRDKVHDNGGKVIAMSDNNFIFSLKEILKALRFRLLLKSHYDGFLVPGESGRKLMRFYGVPKDSVEIGMYSADSSLFKSSVPIMDRPKRIIFVGQLCDRKNIVSFAKTFLSINETERNGWELEICGCGPQKGQIPKDRSIVVRDFLQPEELNTHYQQARVFVLPSKEEHWGLVVHEAALSGCYLLISRQVGAADDFVTNDNGRLFDTMSFVEMQCALRHVFAMSDDDFVNASYVSTALASRISLLTFVNGVKKLMCM